MPLGNRTRRWAQGVVFCPPPGSVYVLRPGGEVFRDAEVMTDVAPEGMVRLSVDVEVGELTPGRRCEQPRLRRMEAETDLLVLPPLGTSPKVTP